MSGSSDDELVGDKDWSFYRDRKEWQDITPIPQDDGPNPIVAIAYSEKFKDAYDYFRGVLKTGEKSERVLSLTADCIALNPANYTVWQYRRDTLRSLNSDLTVELSYVNTMIRCSTKNYQVWHHRKMIVEWLNNADEELEFTECILKKDAKNYHAWQHRQWCIRTFDLYDKELDYVERLLEEDIRNNSAWNQRYFVVSNTTNFEKCVIEREVEFALSKIAIVKSNESAWNYLRGILSNDKEGGLARNERVTKTCEEFYTSGCRVNHLLACIIDICRQRCDSSSSFYSLENALKLCNDLAEEHDKIRRIYWSHVSKELTESMGKQ